MNHDAAQLLEGSGRFVIERELGHGGMGVVYQAVDLERDTRVALKALNQKDAINIYRLKNEFRQLADLSHPNLVSLHELVYEGESWFFTMELVNGTTFDEYVTDGARIAVPPDRESMRTVAGGRIVRDVSATLSQRAIGSEFPLPRATCNVRRLRLAFRQLVEALAALHNAGKLHRDIKPSNVLVTPEGRVVVLDFGLVSNQTIIAPEAQDENRTVGGCVFGTPAYMSPEQAAGETITPASDWYSAGAILYEALTGQLPFDGSVLEILRQKEELEPIPPSEVVKGVPDDLDQLCRDLLRRDPRRRPNGPEILRYLTGHSAPPPIFDAQSATHARQHGELFVGREAHLQSLRRAFEQSKQGKPVTVFVHGLSGMGKSALVRCFANELIKHDDAVVLRGRCYERETVPYKAFDNIIDALSRYMMRLPAEEAAELLPRNVHSLARLFPVLRRVKAIAHARRPKYQTSDARELRNQAFAALKDLLLRITDFQPLVIQIDDLQWADMDSARLLSYLMGPPDPPGLLLVGAYRRDEADNSPFLRHILGEGNLRGSGTEVHEIAVDPLGRSEAAELTSELLRELPTANALFSGTIASEAEGVPFFISELVEHLKSRAASGHHTPASMDSISLDEVLANRIGGMPHDAQRLLEILSVSAGPIEQGIALEAAGLPPGDRASMLSLRAARLIRTRGTRQTDTAETYHDRVRETVVAGMHPDAVRIAHAKIAHAIESWDLGDPERLVDHYTGAGDGVRAGETAVQAAHAAAEKLAFNRAAELYRRAIELIPRDATQQRELHVRLGSALANAGRGALAAEAYLHAAERCEGEAAMARQLKRMAAQQYLRSGRIRAGNRLAQEALSQVGVSWPGSLAGAAAGYLTKRVQLRLRGLDFQRRDESTVPPTQLERVETLGALFQEVSFYDTVRGSLLQGQFLLDALNAGSQGRVVQGLAWEAFHQAIQGGAAREQAATRAVRLAREASSQVPSAYHEALVHFASLSSNLFAGRFADAIGPAGEAERLLREVCPGTSWEHSFTKMLRYTCLEFAGDLSEILHEAPVRTLEATEKDDQYTLGQLIASVPYALLMQDRPDEALDFLASKADALGDGFTTFRHLHMVRMVDALLYANRGVEALQYMEDAWPQFKSSHLARSRFCSTSTTYFYSRAAWAAYLQTGDPAHLRVARRTLSSFHKRDNGFAGFGDAMIASVEHAEGRRESAIAHLRSAIDRFEPQVERGVLYARRRLGEVLGGEEGAAEVAAADSALEAQGISNPQRWVTMVFCPLQASHRGPR